MKKLYTILTILCLAKSAIFAEKIGDIVKSGDTAYMLVCELNTPEANANFQRNINIMQPPYQNRGMLHNSGRIGVK